MVLLSAQGMDVPEIAKVAFTSEDRVRNVIRNFAIPAVQGWPPAEVHLGPAPGIKKIAKSKPAEHDLPFSAWSLSKLAEFPVAELPYL
jgi:hypothetical protein